jgi:hypothetical protein
MKPIQIFALVAAMAVATAAQNTSTSTPNAAPSPAKKQEQDASGKKTPGAKNAATQKNTTGTMGQPGKLQVVIPKDSGQTKMPGSTSPAAKTGAASKNGTSTTGAKTTNQSSATKSFTPATGSAVNKTGNSAGSKSVQPTSAASQQNNAKGSKKSPFGASSASKKQPVLAVTPASKQAKGSKTSSTGKSVTAGVPNAGKKTQPKIVQQKPTVKSNVSVATRTPARVFGGKRRDPFTSPIRVASPTGPIQPPCSTGKRCLSVAELTVQGTAKDTDGKMMAIVASSTHRAYFLRENDQVFNGSVQKITGDSVIFRESITDNLGRQSTHEVVKKINPS